MQRLNPRALGTDAHVALAVSVLDTADRVCALTSPVILIDRV